MTDDLFDAGGLKELFEEASSELFPPMKPKTWDPLSASQIELLEKNGNRSGDWSNVRIAPGSELFTVEDCRFDGEVRLALIPSSIAGATGPHPLLRDSILENMEVGPGCRIVSVGLLSGFLLESDVTVENCGRVTYATGTACGCGIRLELGVETGERTVRSFTLLHTALADILSKGCRSELLGVYGEFLNRLMARLTARPRGLIRNGSLLRGTSLIENCFIGPFCRIENATAVRNSSLLGDSARGSSVTDGALVRDSILQWGALVDSLAIVGNSVVGEHSTVEKHGKLNSSFLGPDSVLGEGEITACLAGPFTAAHHQSLLIAARWPEGRGNVAYGANVGSNHTSRMPDQEIRPGEGMFFGLGCSVKFPSDFSNAPYSIIATGVTALPQRVEMPFSLICEPFAKAEGYPSAFNQIVPAWVLSENLFAVLRNRAKYLTRGRAKIRIASSDVFGTGILKMMQAAHEKLTAAGGREYYTEAHIPGLGKNVLTEEHRQKAIESYTFHLTFRALMKLLERMDAGELPETLLTDVSDDPDWEYARTFIHKGLTGNSVPELLTRLNGMWDRVLEDALRSRAKDYDRGGRIIPDYKDMHGSVEDDPFLSELRSERDSISGRITGLTSH